MQRFEAYEDDNGGWRWRLWAADFELVASSGEAFASQAEALRAAEMVKGIAVDATVESAPGLGMKAARRLRALLTGDPDAVGGAESGSLDLGERPPQVARSARLALERPLTGTRAMGAIAGIVSTRSAVSLPAAHTTTRG